MLSDVIKWLTLNVVLAGLVFLALLYSPEVHSLERSWKGDAEVFITYTLLDNKVRSKRRIFVGKQCGILQDSLQRWLISGIASEILKQINYSCVNKPPLRKY